MTDLSSLALNLGAVLPELIMVLAALVIMVVDMFSSEERPGVRKSLLWLALAGIAAAALSGFWLWSRGGGTAVVTFQNMAVSDRFSLTLNFTVLTAAALGVLVGADAIPRINKQIGEYYVLLLLASAGMMMMGAAIDLITAFLALEIFSLALYILSGMHRNNPRSTEASMKYFLLGAFASAFFVYGAALLYGATGSTRYEVIGNVLASGQGDLYLLYFGLALLIVGFGFKVSLVPFHMWTPDVYQGAPTPVTAFMSAGTKAAGFAALIRLLLVALPTHQETWAWPLAVIAVLTMSLGNLAALRQTSLKRMLAYSSIAHAGYVLVAVVPGTGAGANAALFYLFTYAFMNIGAFAIVIALEEANENDALRNRASGIASRWPLLALVMALFMFSLSGMPPLAGFFGKLFVFKAAVEGGWTWLAVIGMINSAVGVYYYLRVIVAMYFEAPVDETASVRNTWPALRVGLVITAALTIAIGLYPPPWMGIFHTTFGG